MDILIKDTRQGIERKILITDSRPDPVKQGKEAEENSEQSQTLAYIDACRAVFKARQALPQSQERRKWQGESKEAHEPKALKSPGMPKEAHEPEALKSPRMPEKAEAPEAPHSPDLIR